MALKFKAPIFISRSLFKEKAVLLQEQKNVEESYGLTIQELTPHTRRIIFLFFNIAQLAESLSPPTR